MVGYTMRRRVYLHIGQTKTATTTLQAFCSANRAWLRERGVDYPEPPPGHAVRMKHHHLVESLQAPAAEARGAWDLLRRQIDDSPCERILLSDEVFWHLEARHADQRPVAAGWIAEQLAGCEVELLCYLRRQDLWIESWFGQMALGGVNSTSRLPLPEFVALHERIGLLDYAAVLADWASAFRGAQIKVRAFEPAQLVGADVISDFCAQLGIDRLDGAQRPDARQLRLSRPATLLANSYHRAGIDEAHRAQLIEALRRHDGDRVDHRRLLSPREAEALLARWAASNAEVARRYRGGEALFQDMAIHGDDAHYPALTAADHAELMAHLHAVQTGAALPVSAPARQPRERNVIHVRAAQARAHTRGQTRAAMQTRVQETSMPPNESRMPAHAGRCKRVYIYTIPKAGTYLMSAFVHALGWASSGWHVAQNKVLRTLELDERTNREEPSLAMAPTNYLNSFRTLPEAQHSFGHFNPLFVPTTLLMDKEYRVLALRRHPREVLVSEFIDFRHRRRDVAWVSVAAVPDHAEAFALYLRQHGPVIRNICTQFLLLDHVQALPDYRALCGGPRVMTLDFRAFVGDANGPDAALAIARFLGDERGGAEIAALREQALAADNKTKATELALPYERQALWTSAAHEAYEALQFDDLAARLGY